jgi:hypothetical protein
VIRLPSMEFSRVSIETNDGSIEKLTCDMYSGTICRSILHSNYVSVTNMKHKVVEEYFVDSMKLVSNECRRFLLPMICLFIYPLCDEQRMHVRSICRQSCFAFENHPCTKSIDFQQKSIYPHSSFILTIND